MSEQNFRRPSISSQIITSLVKFLPTTDAGYLRRFNLITARAGRWAGRCADSRKFLFTLLTLLIDLINGENWLQLASIYRRWLFRSRGSARGDEGGSGYGNAWKAEKVFTWKMLIWGVLVNVHSLFSRKQRRNKEDKVVNTSNAELVSTIFNAILMVSTETFWWNILWSKIYTTLCYIVSLILRNWETCFAFAPSDDDVQKD